MALRPSTISPRAVVTGKRWNTASGFEKAWARLLLMWVAAILSAVVDNIPFTVTMIPIILGLETSGVNIAPLWWALALGVGLGGNGTHIGATANIIAVSESEKSGMAEAKITPVQWLRTGVPVMLIGLLTASLVYWLLFDLFLTI